MTIRVLVADDQSMVRAGFRMLLAGEEDIEVVAEARNGLEAVEKAARFRPTIVLMDVRMPELDGLEATRRILAADQEARVLILTTFDLDDYIYEGLSAGASGFVLKDDPPEQLIAAIRTVADGDALLSPTITKRVIQEFARVPRPVVERGDRPAALHQRDHREDPRDAHPPEARPSRPGAGGRAGLPERAGQGNAGPRLTGLPLTASARVMPRPRC